MPVRFVLKEKHSDKDTQVYLFFSYQGHRLRYYTGVKLKPSDWNFKKQRAKETRAFPLAKDTNVFFDKLKYEVEKEYRRLINEGQEVSNAHLKAYLNGMTNRKPKEEKKQKFTFLDFYQNLIDTREAIPSYSERTIKGYVTCHSILKRFDKEQSYGLDFHNIDMEFYDSLMQFMFSPENNYSTNYAGTVVKNLKMVLNEASERGIKVNPAYKSKNFKTIQEEVENIYLDVEEIDHLYSLGPEKLGASLTRVRDLLVLACYTGLRFQDFISIRSEHIYTVNGVEMLKMRTQKTGEVVAIPLHPYVKEILAKYGGQAPPSISNQKLNKYLKDLCKVAEMTEEISLTKSVGGKTVEVVLPKYKFVYTHTARRSFATNAFKAGVPSISIMKITGHRTVKNFLKYIKISNEENALLMAENPFFKGKEKSQSPKELAPTVKD